MAAGLLESMLEERGVAADVSSTGRIDNGIPASAHAVDVLRGRGIDISHHRSRVLNHDQLEASDLVLCMEREHLREAVLLDPQCFPRTFTLKELVRRGQIIGPRLAGETLAQWLRRAGLGRKPQDFLGASVDDDVADPFGSSYANYEDTADELEKLLLELVDLAWPVESVSQSA